MSGVLPMWTVYQHLPGAYTAMKWEVTAQGPVLVRERLQGPLAGLRAHFESLGLYRMAPAPNDDPTIVETWL